MHDKMGIVEIKFRETWPNINFPEPGMLWSHRHVDLLVNGAGVFEARARLLGELRAFLTRRRFVEVETPVLAPTAGGAAANPFTTECAALSRVRAGGDKGRGEGSGEGGPMWPYIVALRPL